MCTRGIYQLKRLSIFFCDWGGSSEGVRKALSSNELKTFFESNPQIEREYLLKRGKHPYLVGTYVNGYTKTVPLRNNSVEDVVINMQTARNQFGRHALPHAGTKIFSARKSVQGGWKEGLWNPYPIHKAEKVKELPEYKTTYKQRGETPNRKLEDGRMKYHKDTHNAFMKKRIRFVPEI
mmetsp:Transcript_12049/g.13866  ORF Transcript_12049/g.13866 Transcript_12049/m.13866 type:complete len:179 (+) Transcript_12049:15-551(+)